ncbi:hypothetical protein EVAR_61196_1 [Eumeta japonica]|uniref:Uncharacterized protein n=1 Tax=Eumeta variegata TaxID=151549 RepID=A0A4C1YZB5_EUMVA|nr:hypothetical protein EVAR_61196_1 [Eumeta japonica]
MDALYFVYTLLGYLEALQSINDRQYGFQCGRSVGDLFTLLIQYSAEGVKIQRSLKRVFLELLVRRREAVAAQLLRSAGADARGYRRVHHARYRPSTLRFHILHTYGRYASLSRSNECCASAVPVNISFLSLSSNEGFASLMLKGRSRLESSSVSKMKAGSGSLIRIDIENRGPGP